MIKVYLSSCDKTSHILNSTIYLWKKFTYDKVDITILGFKKNENLKLYNNVHFIELAESQESVNLWSKYIYNYLKNIKDEFIIFAMDDEFPIDYLNENLLNLTLSTLKSNNKYGLCNIGNTIYEKNRPFKFIIDESTYNIWERNANEYKINGQPVLWRTNYLLKQLKRNLTPWEFEIENSKLAINDNMIALHTSSMPGIDLQQNINELKDLYNKKKPILNFGNETALTGNRGISNKINVLGLKLKYIEELINNKLVKSEDLIFGLCKKCHIKYENKKDIFNIYINGLSECCSKNSIFIRYNNYYS